MITGFPSNYTSVVQFPWLAQYGITFANFAAGSSQYGNLKNLATAGGCWNAAAGSANTLNCVNIQITQARNASGLETIKGVELNWVQPLDFLLERLWSEGLRLDGERDDDQHQDDAQQRGACRSCSTSRR